MASRAAAAALSLLALVLRRPPLLGAPLLLRVLAPGQARVRVRVLAQVQNKPCCLPSTGAAFQTRCGLDRRPEELSAGRGASNTAARTTNRAPLAV